MCTEQLYVEYVGDEYDVEFGPKESWPAIVWTIFTSTIPFARCSARTNCCISLSFPDPGPS